MSRPYEPELRAIVAEASEIAARAAKLEEMLYDLRKALRKPPVVIYLDEPR